MNRVIEIDLGSQITLTKAKLTEGLHERYIQRYNDKYI